MNMRVAPVLMVLGLAACAGTGQVVPDDPRAAAASAMEQGRVTDVVSYLAPLVDQGKATAADLVLLGEAYLRRGDGQRALKMAEAAIAKDPASAAAEALAGHAAFLCGKHLVAIRHFEEVLDRGAASAEVHRALAQLYVETGAGESAITEARAAAAAAPDSAAFLLLGQALVMTGDLPGAEAALKRAREQAPEDAAPLFHLGNLYAATGSLPLAVEAYLGALERNPNMVEALRNLGAAYVMADLAEEAVPVLEKAQAIAPDSPEVANNLGVAYSRLDRLTEAIATFEAAWDLASGSPGVRDNLADAYYRDGRLDDAIRLLSPTSKATRDPEEAELLRKLVVLRAYVAERCEPGAVKAKEQIERDLTDLGVAATALSKTVESVTSDPSSLTVIDRAVDRRCPGKVQ